MKADELLLLSGASAKERRANSLLDVFFFCVFLETQNQKYCYKILDGITRSRGDGRVRRIWPGERVSAPSE